MIQTTYKTAIEINDKTYSVIVRDPSLSERQKLEKEAEEKITPLRASQAEERRKIEIDSEIEELVNAYELNKELIKESKITDKLSLLLENKKINAQIGRLKKERAAIANSDIKTLIDTLESLNKEKFELLISGEDKEELKKACSQNGISYTTLWEEIKKEVLKEHEKK